MIERVATIDDSRLSEYRDVPDPELVRARGLFVAEGRLVLQRLVETRTYRLRSVLVSEAAAGALAPVLADLDAGVPVYVCRTADFERLAGFNIHRGCLALAERPPARPLSGLLDGATLVVVLEAVANPDNVGGIFRNAAAFGAGAVVLSPDCCDPLYRKAVRTSMGTVLRTPFARLEAWPAPLTTLRQAGFTLVALTPREPAETLEAFAARPRAARIALIVGAEGPGVSAAVEAAADVRVRIPIRTGIDSLNVAVATGVALYRLTA